MAPRRSLRSPVRVLNFYCLGLSSCVAHAIEAKKGGIRAELDGRSKAAFSAGRRQPQETRGGGGSGVVEAKHHFEANQSASQPGLQCLPRRFFLEDVASRPFPILMQQNKRTGRARGLNEEEFWLRRHRRGRKQKNSTHGVVRCGTADPGGALLLLRERRGPRRRCRAHRDSGSSAEDVERSHEKEIEETARWERG